MNTKLTPEASTSAKTAAQWTSKSNLRPAHREPVQQLQSSGVPKESTTTTEPLLPMENSFAPSSDIHPATPSDPGEPEQTVVEVNDEKQDKPVIWTPESIAEFARKDGAEFFQDQHGKVFAWIRKTEGVQSHFECIDIKSRAFKARLLERIKAKTNTSPPPKALKKAIELLDIQAYGSPKRDLDNRRKVVDGEIFIDLGDPLWKMVAVTRDGWQVRNQDSPRFFRPQHLLSLPEPAQGGDVMDLYKFVPVESEDEKLLMMTWAIAGLYAAIPTPILVFVGQQGSAKTTRSRRLRSLLDPSITPVLGDLEMSDLFLTFQHHAVPCFENVSSFRRREADMFCRAVTGNGVERRKLYTDSDQVLYSFRRPIIMNGIDTPSTRPDFLDRCLIINCQRMVKFTTLQELDLQFEAARPKLFGALLDLLVKVLAVLDNTPADSEFRMADFARFGRAVAIALGKQPEDFDDAYRLNIRQRDFEVLEDAPMTRVLKAFAIGYSEETPWTGTAESLLDALRKVATDRGDTEGKKNLPHSARWLSSRLGEMASALATEGIFVMKLPRTNAKRTWQVFAKSSSVQSSAVR